MKKAKLQLNRETVRVLVRQELASVNGGDAVTKGSRCDPPPPPLVNTTVLSQCGPSDGAVACDPF